MSKIFLADCNNFYVSCERVFNPKLRDKPVVVLSSNDACIIARSNEAKKLNIGMSDPWWKHTALFKRYGVIIYSANFPLYGDMSARVMQLLSTIASEIEIYSVDEAFLRVSEYDGPAHQKEYHTEYAHEMRHAIGRSIGIPVSFGIGPTKTLAKVAMHIAKKIPQCKGVFDISATTHHDALLKKIEIGDIWGIGSRYARFLRSHNITNARDFKYLPDDWVRKHLTITGLRTLWELRGIPCIDLVEYVEPKKSIMVSRLFGKPTAERKNVKEAVAAYTQCAAEKLRAQQSCATNVLVYVVISNYHDGNNYSRVGTTTLEQASSYTPELINAAHTVLETLLTPTLMYKKAGILLSGIVPDNDIQLNLDTVPPPEFQIQLMRMMDMVNSRWGRDTLKYASAGTNQPWKMKQMAKSQCYTTNWHELLTISI